MTILVAFSSRNSSMKFSEVLRRGGVPSMLVNTPRELSLGCGISVSVDMSYTSSVMEALKTFDKSTLLGTYKLIRSGYKMVAVPLR